MLRPLSITLTNTVSDPPWPGHIYYLLSQTRRDILNESQWQVALINTSQDVRAAGNPNQRDETRRWDRERSYEETHENNYIWKDK